MQVIVEDQQVVLKLEVTDQAAATAQAAAQQASIAADEAITVRDAVIEDRTAVASDREAVELARADVEEKQGVASQAAQEAGEILNQMQNLDVPLLEEVHNQFEILDEEGFLIFAIRANGEIYPPTVQSKSIGPEKLADEILYGLVPDTVSPNIFEIVDDEGYVIHAINEKGEAFPPVIQLEPKGTSTPQPEPSALPEIYKASDYVQADKILKNGIWNQWIEPLAAWDGESLFIGGTGNGRGAKGELWLSRNKNGVTDRKKLGVIRTDADNMDDHNAPSILLDDRLDSDFPLIWLQSEHNTHSLQLAKFESKNPINWTSPTFNEVPGTVAYSQAWRYEDEIFVLSRASGGGRPWRIAYSADNGSIWLTKTIFSSAASWLYCLGKVKENGLGVNIAFHGHPLNSTEQSIFFLEFDFTTGSVYNPENRSTPVINDLRAAIQDPEFSAIDPFLEGLKIYEATAPEITRLWDIGRHDSGECFCILNTSPSNATDMDNFNNSDYKVVSFNLDDGTINYTISIEDAGLPIENPVGINMYFAGACVLGSTNQFVVFTYKNQSQLDGGSDTTDNAGKTVGRIVSVNGPEDVVKRVFVESTAKCIRPYSVAGSDYFLYCEAEKFRTYKDFKSNIIIENLNEL